MSLQVGVISSHQTANTRPQQLESLTHWSSQPVGPLRFQNLSVGHFDSWQQTQQFSSPVLESLPSFASNDNHDDQIGQQVNSNYDSDLPTESDDWFSVECQQPTEVHDTRLQPVAQSLSHDYSADNRISQYISWVAEGTNGHVSSPTDSSYSDSLSHSPQFDYSSHSTDRPVGSVDELAKLKPKTAAKNKGPISDEQREIRRQKNKKAQIDHRKKVQEKMERLEDENKNLLAQNKHLYSMIDKLITDNAKLRAQRESQFVAEVGRLRSALCRFGSFQSSNFGSRLQHEMQ